MIKIAAWSDGHGTLPKIDKSDIMIIAGDIVPLNIQRSIRDSLDWFIGDFFDYVKNAPCEKVLLVPGNHDFLFENFSAHTIKDIIETNGGLNDKLIYLADEEYTYKDLVFYGCPWCTGPYGWAFCPCDTNVDVSKYYDAIPEHTNVLITHQPPKIDKVGCSYPYQPYERNFGSDQLKDTIDRLPNLKYAFCGHIHTGVHNGILYDNKMIYNVSLKNEGYNDVYDVTYVTI